MGNLRDSVLDRPFVALVAYEVEVGTLLAFKQRSSDERQRVVVQLVGDVVGTVGRFGDVTLELNPVGRVAKELVTTLPLGFGQVLDANQRSSVRHVVGQGLLRHVAIARVEWPEHCLNRVATSLTTFLEGQVAVNRSHRVWCTASKRRNGQRTEEVDVQEFIAAFIDEQDAVGNRRSGFGFGLWSWFGVIGLTGWGIGHDLWRGDHCCWRGIPSAPVRDSTANDRESNDGHPHRDARSATDASRTGDAGCGDGLVDPRRGGLPWQRGRNGEGKRQRRGATDPQWRRARTPAEPGVLDTVGDEGVEGQCAGRRGVGDEQAVGRVDQTIIGRGIDVVGLIDRIGHDGRDRNAPLWREGHGRAGKGLHPREEVPPVGSGVVQLWRTGGHRQGQKGLALGRWGVDAVVVEGAEVGRGDIQHRVQRHAVGRVGDRHIEGAIHRVGERRVDRIGVEDAGSRGGALQRPQREALTERGVAGDQLNVRRVVGHRRQVGRGSGPCRALTLAHGGLDVGGVECGGVTVHHERQVRGGLCGRARVRALGERNIEAHKAVSRVRHVAIRTGGPRHPSHRHLEVRPP